GGDRSTLGPFERDAVVLRGLGVTRAERIVRYPPGLLARQLVHRLPRHGRRDGLRGTQYPGLRTDEWLFQVDRIVDLGDGREVQAVAEDVFGHHAVRTRVDADLLNDAELHVRGRDRQLAGMEGARGKARPCVFGMRRRMRAAVEPDGAIGTAEHANDPQCEQLIGDRIANLVDPYVRSLASHGILRGVR